MNLLSFGTRKYTSFTKLFQAICYTELLWRQIFFRQSSNEAYKQRSSFLSQYSWLKASYQMSNIQIYIIIIKNPYSCESSFRSLNIYGGSDSILLLARSLQKQPQVGYSKFLLGSVILWNSFAISRYVVLFYWPNKILFIM